MTRYRKRLEIAHSMALAKAHASLAAMFASLTDKEVEIIAAFDLDPDKLSGLPSGLAERIKSAAAKVDGCVDDANFNLILDDLGTDEAALTRLCDDLEKDFLDKFSGKETAIS